MKLEKIELENELVIIDTENHGNLLVLMFCTNLSRLGVESRPNFEGKIFAFIKANDKRSMKIIEDEIDILNESLRDL